MSSHPYAWCLAVVGDHSGVMTDSELWSLLDLLVNRHVGERRIVLLSSRHSPGEASRWAAARGHSVHLAASENAVKLACSLVEMADGLVVLGDPAPFARLVELARGAGGAAPVVRARPGPAPAPPPPRPRCSAPGPGYPARGPSGACDELLGPDH